MVCRLWQLINHCRSLCGNEPTRFQGACGKSARTCTPIQRSGTRNDAPPGFAPTNWYDWASGVRTGVGQTGVVGLLEGTAPEDHGTVAFRAEMDALPMDDMCGTPYESLNPGAAHLCGHDGHVAALLGAAQVLSELRSEIPGSVKFFFEPAEEMTPPTEKMGAKAMIDDGAWKTRSR